MWNDWIEQLNHIACLSPYHVSKMRTFKHPLFQQLEIPRNRAKQVIPEIDNGVVEVPWKLPWVTSLCVWWSEQPMGPTPSLSTGSRGLSSESLSGCSVDARCLSQKSIFRPQMSLQRPVLNRIAWMQLQKDPKPETLLEPLLGPWSSETLWPECLLCV